MELCSDCKEKIFLRKEAIECNRGEWVHGNIACVHIREQRKDFVGEDTMQLTFDDLMAELRNIHDRKNHDYAGASSGDPLDNFKKVGERVVCEHCHKPVGAIIAVQVLRATKSVRLENLALRGKPENESVEDSLKDEAVYALLETMLRHEQNNPGEIKDDF